jgi:hypothetical protein
MLEIRHKNGRITSKGYAWLLSAKFDPSSGTRLISQAIQLCNGGGPDPHLRSRIGGAPQKKIRGRPNKEQYRPRRI